MWLGNIDYVVTIQIIIIAEVIEFSRRLTKYRISDLKGNERYE